MTTTVKVSAHCASNKEVLVELSDDVTERLIDSVIIQDGETTEMVVYDNLRISVIEYVK